MPSFLEMFKVDAVEPMFLRSLRKRSGEEVVVKIWQPVQADDGTWGCACLFDTGGEDQALVAPGFDALQALLSAVKLVRSRVEKLDDVEDVHHLRYGALPRISFDFEEGFVQARE